MSIAEYNVRKLYWISALTSMWFVAGNWLYFYRRYMHDGQLGILDGVTFAIGFLVEIPSGTLADRFGRKKILVLGLILNVVGFLLHAVGGYKLIFIAQTCLTVGWAFVSGADDALVYDSLQVENKESTWKKVIAKKYQITIGVTLLSYLAGAILYSIWFRLAFIVEGIVIIPAVFIALSMKENIIKEHKSTNFMDTLKDGMTSLFKGKNITYALIALIFLGVGYSFDFGTLTTFNLDRVGVHASGQAITLTISGLLSIFILSKLENIRSLRDEKLGLFVTVTVMTLSILLLGLASSLLIGVMAIMLVRICSNTLLPWLNDLVQHNVSSRHRATALSSLAVLYKIPYILIAPIAGIMSQNGNLSNLLLSLGVIMAISVMVYVSRFRYITN